MGTAAQREGAIEDGSNGLSGTYPLPTPDDGLKLEIKEARRSYKDEAAAALFAASGGRELVKAKAQASRALVKQAEKLEMFSSTPFTEQNIQTIKVNLEAIERMQAMLRSWHELIYPNQRTS